MTKPKKVTAATVNAALKARGYKERIIQGEGYVYFINIEHGEWESIYINKITDIQDVEWWIDQRNQLAKKYAPEG